MITRRTFVALTSAAAAAPALAFAHAEVKQGRIETLSKFDPSDKGEPRVRVWLPPGYDSGSPGGYRAFYMLDRQHAFAGERIGRGRLIEHDHRAKQNRGAE